MKMARTSWYLLTQNSSSSCCADMVLTFFFLFLLLLLLLLVSDFTGERIAWRPKLPASDMEGDSGDLDPGANLPKGWLAVESESMGPGEVVYENGESLVCLII